MAERVHFITAEGRKRLEEELAYLRTVKRQQVAENLKSALDEGDLSENAAYEESKREQAFLEGRIRELENVLANAALVEESGQRDVVTIGARVTVAEDGSAPETYQIVGRTEADPLKGRISNESPLGRALLGRRVGDRVEVETPGGLVPFEILAIH